MRFIALHPDKGIALIDNECAEMAVAPLEDFLSESGIPALRTGAIPIVPVHFPDGAAQIAGTPGVSNNQKGTEAFVGSGPYDQDTIYTITQVAVARGAAIKVNTLTASVGKTIGDAPATKTHAAIADANALTANAGEAFAGASTDVTYLGGAIGVANGTLANSVNSLTQPLKSLAPPVR